MIKHDKAYLLGLLTGGGTISNGTFLIRLPFKKWGMNPNVMNKIAVDILTKICNKFQKLYGFPVTYEIGNSVWTIKPLDNPDISKLIGDLQSLELPTTGFLLNNADLTKAKKELEGIIAESFLTGIFDTRASLALSHRRFTNEAPAVSLEIPGSTKNFIFVVQICSWLTDLGSTTDQILFNHPCQHSAADPTYRGWKKGFKIRFLVKSFLAKHSFALQAKAFDIQNLEKLQEKHAQEPCSKRKIRRPSPVCIHSDIDSPDLPKEVRNKLFLHYFHFCGVYGCKHAPIKELTQLLDNYPDYIFVLPRIEKGNIENIKSAYYTLRTAYFKKKDIEEIDIVVKDLFLDENYKSYLELGQGIAFLFSETLNGKRHSGSKDLIIKKSNIKIVKLLKVTGKNSYPILLQNETNNRAVLISSLTSELNQKLVKQRIERNGLNINLID